MKTVLDRSECHRCFRWSDFGAPVDLGSQWDTIFPPVAVEWPVSKKCRISLFLLHLLALLAAFLFYKTTRCFGGG